MERVGGRRPIIGGDEFNAKKILNLKYTVALGGRRLLATHINQLGVGGRGKRDVGEEVRGGWNVWEGGVQSLEATNLTQKKISNKKYTVTLGGRRSMNLHTTTNQKQALIMEKSKERRDDRQGSAGGCKSIILGAIAVK